VRLVWSGSQYIEAIAFDWHSADVVAEGSELAVQNLAHGRFVSSNRLDVHQLARERNDVHAEKHT
jgi:hypothetical protein